MGRGHGIDCGRWARGRSTNDPELLAVQVTEEQLELLRSLHLDCREGLLDKPVRGREGLSLGMSRLNLDDRVGCLLSPPRITRGMKGRTAMLHDIADELEAVLTARPLRR